jgi:3'(2'), 5'-bisphosphate nucleotidase
MLELIRLKDIDLDALLEVAREAGRSIMSVYNQNYSILEKSDGSPMTMADQLSNTIINQYLSANFSLPILSEENDDVSFSVRRNWSQYWLIDPLDGTKEFVNKRREFTVNIALIQNDKPVLGIIYAPMFEEMFYAMTGFGSFFEYKNTKERLERKSQIAFENGKIIHKPGQHIKLILSRSHSSGLNISHFLNDNSGSLQTISMGSSLKFCRVAQGKVDINIRINPTMEWDTAAGQVIVEESGHNMIQIEGLKPLSYNKENLVNPGFVVF